MRMDSRRKNVARVHAINPTVKAVSISLLAAFFFAACMPRPLSVVRLKDDPRQRRQIIIECSDVEHIYGTEAKLDSYGIRRMPLAMQRSQIVELELAGQRSVNLGLYTGLGGIVGGLGLGFAAGLANGSVGSYEVPGLLLGGVLGLSIGLPHLIGGYRMKAQTRRKAQWQVGANNLVTQADCRGSTTNDGTAAPPNGE